MNGFKLSVDRLTEEPQHYDFEASPEWWEAREPADREEFCRVETPFEVSCDVSRIRDPMPSYHGGSDQPIHAGLRPSDPLPLRQRDGHPA